MAFAICVWVWGCCVKYNVCPLYFVCCICQPALRIRKLQDKLLVEERELIALEKRKKNICSGLGGRDSFMNIAVAQRKEALMREWEAEDIPLWDREMKWDQVAFVLEEIRIKRWYEEVCQNRVPLYNKVILDIEGAEERIEEIKKQLLLLSPPPPSLLQLEKGDGLKEQLFSSPPSTPHAEDP